MKPKISYHNGQSVRKSTVMNTEVNWVMELSDKDFRILQHSL